MTTTAEHPDGYTALKANLHSDDLSVRFNAGLDLVKLGKVDGIPVLIEAFEHESAVMRLFHAGRTLIELGEPAVPALNNALLSDNIQVRVAAAYTLYQIDNDRLDELLPIVMTVLEGENPHSYRNCRYNEKLSSVVS